MNKGNAHPRTRAISSITPWRDGKAGRSFGEDVRSDAAQTVGMGACATHHENTTARPICLLRNVEDRHRLVPRRRRQIGGRGEGKRRVRAKHVRSGQPVGCGTGPISDGRRGGLDGARDART